MPDDTARGIARNTGVMLAQQVLTLASSFILLLVLPRYLGPEQYGWVFLASSVLGVVNSVVNYGGNYLVAKTVARSRESAARMVVDATVMRLLLLIPCAGGLTVFLALSRYQAAAAAVILLIVAQALWKAPLASIVGTFQGFEKMHLTAAGAILERLLLVLLVLAAVAGDASVITIAALTAGANLAHFLLMAGFARREVAPFPRVDWADVRTQFREGLPYFLLISFGTIYYRIDSLMLSWMTPPEVVGWYGAAYRLFESTHFLPYVLSVAVYPVLSRLWTTDGGAHGRTLARSLEVLMLIAVPACLGPILFADPLVGLFFGAEGYAPSAVLLRVLMTGGIFLFVNMLISTSLLSTDRQWKQAAVAFGAIPFTVALNLALIPWFQQRYGNGALGAGLATVVTEVAVLVALSLYLPSGSLRGFRLSVLPKALIAGGGMALTALGAGAAGAPWIIAALVALCVYAGLVVGLRALSREEFSALTSLRPPWLFRKGLRPPGSDA